MQQQEGADTISHSHTSQRYAGLLQREDVSIHQFSERIHQYGWIAERLSRDIGEDIFVRIIVNDQPAGVPIYVQLKSIDNLEERHKKQFIKYRLEVGDINRWEHSATPVIVVVWDTVLSEGRWMTVRAMADELDQRKPSWRSQKTVTTHIPWHNRLDNSGLSRLKAEIGMLVYPSISAGRIVEVGFDLASPTTNSEQDQHDAIEKFFLEGGSVSIEGDALQGFKISDWWQDWFLEEGYSISRLEIGPIVDKKSKPASIVLISDEAGTSNFHGIDFRIIQQGSHLVILSSAAQGYPVTFTLQVAKDHTNQSHRSFTLNCSLNDFGNNSYEARNIFRFMRGMRAGGKLAVVFDKHPNAPINVIVESEPGYCQDSVDDDRKFEDFFDALCVVQDRLERTIKILVDISADDMRNALTLKEIVEKGVIKRTVDMLAFTLGDREPLEQILNMMLEDSAVSCQLGFQQGFEEYCIDLFGEEICVGPMHRATNGRLATTEEQIRSFLARNSSDSRLPIQLVDVQITDVFSNWYSPNNVSDTH